MSFDLLDERFVKRCAAIDSPEEYHTFLEELRDAVRGRTLLPTIEELLGPSSAGVEHVNALMIGIAVEGTHKAPSKDILDRLVSQATYNLTQVASHAMDAWRIAPAALCLVNRRVDDDAHVRQLLLAKDSSTPSPASKDGCYFLIKFMGFSGNTGFTELLHEVIKQRYHFCFPLVTATALKNLGLELYEGDIPYVQPLLDRPEDCGRDGILADWVSISVDTAGSENAGRQEILIGTDWSYSGSSNCPDCRFFPCRINLYYRGAIEDCTLLNTTDPETLGDIRDVREWGEHLVPEALEVDLTQKEILRQCRGRMEEKAYCQAIPGLCAVIVLVERPTEPVEAHIMPLAWLYLSDCFSAHSEKGLAFIAMREAVGHKHLVRHTDVAEQRRLELFDNKSETIIGEIADVHTAIRDIEHKAINYKARNQWVKALDCYVYANICNGGKSGGNWFEMGECHRELGEYGLAELFMRRGAAIARKNYDNELTGRFSAGADNVHKNLHKKEDVGLSIERRREERGQMRPKIECGFRVDTYDFLEISERAKEVTHIRCQETRDYFDLAKAAYGRGDLELAIEIMKSAVNYESFYIAKAYPLYMAGRLQCELREYDKAMKYFEWAMELKPDDEDIRNAWTELAERSD